MEFKDAGAIHKLHIFMCILHEHVCHFHLLSSFLLSSSLAFGGGFAFFVPFSVFIKTKKKKEKKENHTRYDDVLFLFKAEVEIEIEGACN